MEQLEAQHTCNWSPREVQENKQKIFEEVMAKNYLGL